MLKTSSVEILASSPTYWEDTRRGLQLRQGDALDLLREQPTESYDLIFVDPPYFLSNGGSTCRSGKRAAVNKGNWDHTGSFEDMHRFNLAWLTECHRLLRPTGSIWVCGTSHNIHSIGYVLQSLNSKILNEIAWFKVNPPPNLSCRYFTHATETLLWARKDIHARHVFHYDAMKQENGGKQMLSLWSILPPRPREKRFGRHPTQKPEALLERILRATSNPGDKILDPFCGSGTTGVACARLRRDFMGFERDGDFLQLAQRRMEAENQSQFVFDAKRHFASPIGCVFEGTDTWQAIVRDALYSLGGEAALFDIYRAVEMHQRVKSIPTWTATVRRILRQAADFVWLGEGRYRLAWM